MNHETIERYVEIDATPETVFEVITDPEHVRQWWPDDANFEPAPGSTGHLVFGDPSSPDAQVPQITIVAVEAPRLFSFRWVYPDGEAAIPGNSLLVTFELSPRGSGTVLHLSETGFADKGWEPEVAEAEYGDHCAGWDHFLPQLVDYAPTVGARA
ncbi:SRPBCC family protein [Ilumatobacter coccineus]|uniref:Activator of Hsp90 ATPase homologue 1/2-like C-terminal domain-containing protein n=1 Tax=Ilumatobacter coccineus (strain NBRC 103263 / KCTC 29153 / YM16-304) TaxID=1313172 RepID=A0A6C7E8H4_ILUCY|nr:SRPBCC family protein [Ilumatobacter coccineus]BAN01499.1 hypothetical protein YM304_11850 [Ilumatobacter coccineus YM16-304]